MYKFILLIIMESNASLTKNWIRIYPSYIDKELIHSEGRKVSLLYAVEKPTVPEIFIVCKELFGLDCAIERNHHPKDWLKRGRVVVYLKEGKNSLLTDIANKNTLIKRIGESITSVRNNTVIPSTDDGKKKRRKK
jgi:signal recognition particle subunit SEC65